jgi:hypothetical protein
MSDARVISGSLGPVELTAEQYAAFFDEQPYVWQIIGGALDGLEVEIKVEA